MDKGKYVENATEKGRELIGQQFTDEKRDKTKTKLLILLGATLLTISFNNLLSYLAYAKNPSYFVENNMYDSFIGFTVTGNFPHTYALAIVLTIFLLLFAYFSVRNNKMKYVSSVWTFILMGVIFNIWQILGGLLWIPLIFGKVFGGDKYETI